MKKITYLVLLFSIVTLSIQAQVMNPVKWETSFAQEGEDYVLTFSATIDDGWYVYSSRIGDGGPYPLTLEFDTEGGFDLVGELEEIGEAKKSYDKIFEMDLIKYGNQLIAKQKLSVDKDLKVIEGYLTFMTCDDQKCLPPTDVDFSFDIE